jgi:hypothetical protein
VKIAETFLEDDETVDAETFVNRASTVINNVPDWALLLRYKARIHDNVHSFTNVHVFCSHTDHLRACAGLESEIHRCSNALL